MKREPAVIFHRRDGSSETVIHGTEMRARRNAAILGSRASFVWVETETLVDKVRHWWSQATLGKAKA